MTDESDRICAICKHQKLFTVYTMCGNPKQENEKLKIHTDYFSTCPLWEMRDESFYDEPKTQEDELP